ncbi:energy transducer TonB [Flavobacteriaceae bacterium S0862]|nr:energy transducer TonB [Flavobacteriaceae bacterium S0862]
MSVSNTYKALIITALLSTAVILLGFTIHIKKKSKLVAETFYEMDAEAVEEEEKEELEDIIKSLDNLMATPATNQAFNETKTYENDKAVDEAFEEQMEAIKNRTSIEELKAANQDNNVLTASNSGSNKDKSSAFGSINNIVSKRLESQKNADNSANKNSSVSYSLVDRLHTFLPTPIYLCEQGGKIVVNITVNHEGNVVDAYINASSSSENGCLIDHALEYAKESKFNKNPKKASQLGTITFLFRGKN